MVTTIDVLSSTVSVTIFWLKAGSVVAELEFCVTVTLFCGGNTVLVVHVVDVVFVTTVVKIPDSAVAVSTVVGPVVDITVSPTVTDDMMGSAAAADFVAVSNLVIFFVSVFNWFIGVVCVVTVTTSIVVTI